jgi:C4-dicarboxylate-specific signal transduction histidine kinase
LKPRTTRSSSRTDGRRRRAVPPAVEPHLQILHTVAEAVSRTLDVGDVLRTAVEALTRVTGHEIASLHLLSEDGKTLYLRGERGMSPGLRDVNQTLPVGAGLVGRVASTGRTVLVETNYVDPDLLPAARDAVQREQIRGFVCVPIHSRGRILGTLSLGRKTLDRFEATEVALLEATADQIGLALDNARLYSETRRQLDELQRAHTQLVHAEKLSAVGKLASGVAHEINNPLTTILGQTHLMLADPSATEPVRERLKIVTDEAARAARIIQNLLLFARRYPPERRPCTLSDQARRVLELKSYQLQQDNVKIVTEFTPSPWVLGDENQLQQVILNLVQNAHQAMVQRAAARVLTVRCALDGTRVRLEVRDTGPGIPVEVMPRIFDPFFTTKAPGEGSGLGLSVSYGIVAELGGRLWAENRPEGGASFFLELPVGDDTH